ncbi:hypothetical protein CL3_21420 [butyrate-producing bacterium SM4/1]|nr:hypothetical protein CLOM621_05240 [Clostridium sp. M62/1]CBK77194.1 hypothetical protein CLS_16190 [[Clostridium] cf. saccharolyticum K10]CBL36456.1 hypothetical protein CL3_21420 [butyrate-producing bacterium SM4/1]
MRKGKSGRSDLQTSAVCSKRDCAVILPGDYISCSKKKKTSEVSDR